jgi:hypothetical protein
MGEKPEEELTCQLYATIPLGSLTANQEMLNGTVTEAPLPGLRGEGAGGPAGGTGVGVGVGVREPCCAAEGWAETPRTAIARARIRATETRRNTFTTNLLR